MLQALYQLHLAGRTHRDFKPMNVVVTGYEGTGKRLSVKIIDWANSCHDSEGEHTLSVVDPHLQQLLAGTLCMSVWKPQHWWH